MHFSKCLLASVQSFAFSISSLCLSTKSFICILWLLHSEHNKSLADWNDISLSCLTNNCISQEELLVRHCFDHAKAVVLSVHYDAQPSRVNPSSLYWLSTKLIIICWRSALIYPDWVNLLSAALRCVLYYENLDPRYANLLILHPPSGSILTPELLIGGNY